MALRAQHTQKQTKHKHTKKTAFLTEKTQTQPNTDTQTTQVFPQQPNVFLNDAIRKQTTGTCYVFVNKTTITFYSPQRNIPVLLCAVCSISVLGWVFLCLQAFSKCCTCSVKSVKFFTSFARVLSVCFTALSSQGHRTAVHCSFIKLTGRNRAFVWDYFERRIDAASLVLRSVFVAAGR